MLDFDKLTRFQGFQMQIMTQIPIWSEAYKVEREEIERQILLAHGWLINNPQKRPKKLIMRYLSNWMSIADRKGSMRRAVEKVVPKATEAESDMTFEEMQEIRRRNFPQRHTAAFKFKDAVDTEITGGQNA